MTAQLPPRSEWRAADQTQLQQRRWKGEPGQTCWSTIEGKHAMRIGGKQVFCIQRYSKMSCEWQSRHTSALKPCLTRLVRWPIFALRLDDTAASRDAGPGPAAAAAASAKLDAAELTMLKDEATLRSITEKERKRSRDDRPRHAIAVRRVTQNNLQWREPESEAASIVMRLDSRREMRADTALHSCAQQRRET